MRVLLIVLAGCVLLAGCGGGRKKAVPAKPVPVQPLAESCKQQVAARDYVPEGKKPTYYKQCQGAVPHGAQAVRQTTRDVCVDIEQRYLKADPPEKRQALSNCESWLVP